MNLLDQYSQLLPPQPRIAAGAEGFEHWNQFLNASDDVICVVAGRRTGKTTAILRRATYQRERDVIIVTGFQQQTKNIWRALLDFLAQEGLSSEVTLMGSDRGNHELYVNNHTITLIEDMGPYIRSMFNMKEIIFDEPECRGGLVDFERILDGIRGARLIMVGSLFRRDSTNFKDFYRYSERHGLSYKISLLDMPGGREEAETLRQNGMMSLDRMRLELFCQWDDDNTESRRGPIMSRLPGNEHMVIL